MQLNLLDTAPRFDGADYTPERDDSRLRPQMDRIYSLMRDGKWRTLGEIAERTGAPPASVSAQLRHLRKRRFGGYLVEKRYLRDGLYTYRVTDGPR
jgi:hypothetical protein